MQQKSSRLYHKPYHKPDNKITCINVQSNHPPNIIKQLPKTNKKEHNLVQSTIQQKCGNKGWSLLFKIIR